MKTYPLFKVHVASTDALRNIGDVFVSGYINEGVQVTELTNALSQKLSAPHIALTNSCTSALTLALKLSGVGPGTEVISTPMTCVATNAAIASLGAKIVWADVNPESGMIDPESVRARVTDKTRAAVSVAWAGVPPAMRHMKLVCRAMGIKHVLDAAHAFGATYEGLPVHHFADTTAYSFQAIKHFTTGDGGALVCADPLDHERAKALKWFGLDRDKSKDDRGDWKGQQWDVDIKEVGFKFNMNNLAAAVGLSQLPHIDSILASHRRHAAMYDELFNSCASVVPNKRPRVCEPSHWVYGMRIVPRDGRISRDGLLHALNAEGIMAGVVHVPNDDYTCFASSRVDLPGVREFASAQFNLPCGWWLDENVIGHIAKRVMELVT